MSNFEIMFWVFFLTSCIFFVDRVFMVIVVAPHIFEKKYSVQDDIFWLTLNLVVLISVCFIYKPFLEIFDIYAKPQYIQYEALIRSGFCFSMIYFPLLYLLGRMNEIHSILSRLMTPDFYQRSKSIVP